MEKRLKRSDLMYSLAFLLMLVVAIGAFFYGVKVGSEKTEEEHLAEASPMAKSEPASPTAYQQQDLVSFYHTVFLPYREFQNAWYTQRTLWLDDSTVDRSASLKELAKIAKKKYDTIRVAYVVQSSPLLKDAQKSYMKSLKLFHDGFNSKVAKANEGSAADLFASLDSDSFYKEGRAQALTAQKQYYGAMLKWGASVNLDIPADYSAPKVFGVAHWKSLPLIVKNKAIADYLAASGIYAPYLPQDLTARIDQLIRSGQADKMKLKTVGSIAELLTDTDAVRSGDFLVTKAQLYEKQLLPTLPFFSPDK